MKYNRYCKFDSTTGIKTYKTKEICDSAYNGQMKAYELGLAPPVIKRIDDFSFQSGIVDTSFFMENFKEGVYYNRIFPQMEKLLIPIFKEIPTRCGPNGVDMGRHNLGLWKGKVVMIDFS